MLKNRVILTESWEAEDRVISEARRIWSFLLPLWAVGGPAASCTRALQAGRNTTILFLVRLCGLADEITPVLRYR